MHDGAGIESQVETTIVESMIRGADPVQTHPTVKFFLSDLS